MATITYQDVGKTLGRPILDTDECAQITLWISDAELVIKNRLGDLAQLDQDNLKYVVREAVALKVKNPDGLQNERIDDYSYGRTDEASTGDIFIRDSWWRMLDADAAGDGAFTIRPRGTGPCPSPTAPWTDPCYWS